MILHARFREMLRFLSCSAKGLGWVTSARPAENPQEALELPEEQQQPPGMPSARFARLPGLLCSSGETQGTNWSKIRLGEERKPRQRRGMRLGQSWSVAGRAPGLLVKPPAGTWGQPQPLMATTPQHGACALCALAMPCGAMCPGDAWPGAQSSRGGGQEPVGPSRGGGSRKSRSPRLLLL